jgi:hypothetical protein
MGSPKASFSTTRPPSQLQIKDRLGGLNIVRDQQSLATWLLVGATVQCLLLYLPLDARYLVLPALALAGFKLLQGIVAVSTYKPASDGRAISKPMHARLDTDQDSTGGVCVLLLGLSIDQ